MITRDPTPRIPQPRHSARERRRRGPLAVLATMGATVVLATSCGGGAAAESATSPGPSVPQPETTTGDLTEQDVNAWLDGMVPAYLDEAQIAGASVSVVSDGEVLASRGYGYSDVAEEKPVDPDETLFRVGSVSKTFTATAVMQLVESGELDLDTDVAEYLDFELDKSFDEDVTLRHLLSHTGGFEERVANAMVPEGEEMPLREVVANDPPEQVFEPGTMPAYSNYGIALAGYIVENVSGTPYAEYVDQNVLALAGMDSSTAEQPLPEDLQERLSESYATDEDPPTEMFENVSDAPAGSMTSSATDMGRFMLAQLGQPQESPVLRPETLSEMHEPALGSDSLGGLAGGDQMTLGFFEAERNGHRIVSHGGDTPTFHSEMQLYPDDNAGIFVTLNSSGNKDLVSQNLRMALAEGFADRYFPGEQTDGEGVDDSTAAEHAAMVEGAYMDSRSMQSTFGALLYTMEEPKITATEDGTIIAPSPATGHKQEYEEIEPWVWREVDGHRTLAANVVDGEVQSIGTTAMSRLPADSEKQASVVLPILGGSLVVFLIAFVSWPVGAFVRWKLSLPRREKAGRWARVLTRAAMVATVLACAGWWTAVTMAENFVPVSFAMLRGFQVLQGLGLLGIIPAAVVLFDNIRHRQGWERYVGSALVLLALLGAGWVAVTHGMVTGSVSF